LVILFSLYADAALTAPKLDRRSSPASIFRSWATS